MNPSGVSSANIQGEQWADFLASVEGSQITDEGVLSTRWMESSYFIWANSVTIDAVHLSETQIKNAIDQSIDYALTRKQPGCFIVHNAPANIGNLTSARGLKLYAKCTGMVADISRLTEASPIEGLEFRKVTAPTDLEAFANINAHAYQMPIEGAMSVWGPTDYWIERGNTWLGIYRGQPVTLAATIPRYSSKVNYLHWVATLPEYERRGFGQAVCRKALVTSFHQTGSPIAMVHATEAGSGLYKLFGFETKEPMLVFDLPGQNTKQH